MRYQISFVFKGTLFHCKFKTYKGLNVCMRRLKMRGIDASTYVRL